MLIAKRIQKGRLRWKLKRDWRTLMQLDRIAAQNGISFGRNRSLMK